MKSRKFWTWRGKDAIEVEGKVVELLPNTMFSGAIA